MANRVFALLVGINDYLSPVNPLKGCVNDVTQMDQLLEERLKQDSYFPHILTNAEAERQAIMDAFSQHLGQAQALARNCTHRNVGS
jgi:hypothetical protein